MHPLLLAFLFGSAPADSGQVLYNQWCAFCHGADGRGKPSSVTHLDVDAPDLTRCAVSTAEPEDRWVAIARQGGRSVGLSAAMPPSPWASEDQLRAVVRYMRTFCSGRGWPPGELNFPRPFLVEKAFPENEVVLVNSGSDQEYILEKRVGSRLQFEALAKTSFDGEPDAFAGAAVAAKYAFWHSLRTGALASLGVETALPVGRQTLWEVEPFLTAGWSPGAEVYLQGEVLGTWDETDGFTDGQVRFGVGKGIGRVVPMVEMGWVIPIDGDPIHPGRQTVAFYPEMWIQLSRLGHIALSLGAEMPTIGPGSRATTFFGFVLWDFADAGLFRGW